MIALSRNSTDRRADGEDSGTRRQESSGLPEVSFNPVRWLRRAATKSAPAFS